MIDLLELMKQLAPAIGLLIFLWIASVLAHHAYYKTDKKPKPKQQVKRKK